ncbi:accessory Sec system glycosyltransferase GtfA [Lactobacillus sp. YT155]|uniref:accessory Sec system glycosyltransferase GtfA n=1 Tax=Lactobacillus sp. YT155 TaxID=3060955 RepID=UPI00265DB1B9|nr:accessory Sec system glycosyltransferase GtfA [Lactobacillus sp. YT155]MDO1605359.1 accessory Sec system glycosyltransferase GtfA [Lactobacillus sp. YT155]
MTIYNLNIGIGWASSGVEYAQAYRSNIFKKNKQKAKFIFTDLFDENLEPMTKNIGFDDEEIIWMYQFFTDVKISPTTFTYSDLEATFGTEPEEIKDEGYGKYYSFDNNKTVIKAFHDTHCGPDAVHLVHTYVNGDLIQKDNYTYVKTFSEYYKPNENSDNLYQRRFFNENGSVAYDELLNGEQSLYIFEDRTIYSKEALSEYFLRSLGMNENDILIMDRSTDNGPSIIKTKDYTRVKVGVVVHAEHFNEPITTEDHILWNNFYEYQFENADSIDFFITATELQKQLIEEQFVKYHKGNIKIYAIPVGSIDKLTVGNNRQKHSLITASRLAGEKHVDWLVEAVIKAHEQINDLSLDIYGLGSQMMKLQQMIEAANAGSYIRVMGHRDLTDIYCEYDGYISGSTSEGFGLTLLEAVGSGLPLIGLDVKYGNQTFIDDGENGYLLEYYKNDTPQNIQDLADAIVKMMSDDEKMEQMRQHSYEIAKDYLTQRVQEKWIQLEKEQVND